MNTEPLAGLKVVLMPPTFIEDAAQAEGWTASDWQHCEKMLREAYEKSFEVKTLQRDEGGLYAYDSPYVTFEGVLFRDGVEKPVLQALKELSHALLLRKQKHEGEHKT